MTRTLPPHIVVVGGGMAGLVAAYRLRQAARERPLTITLVEAQSRLGGWVETLDWQGARVERGPDSFLTSKPAALQLALELGLGSQLQAPIPGPTFIAWRGRLEPLPDGLWLVVPTRLGPILRSRLLSPWGKASVLLDLVLPPRPRTDDEPLGALLRRRFGAEFVARIAQPLLHGAYAGDLDEISVQALAPQLAELERRYGSLIQGARARLRERRTPSQPPFLSLQGGMGTLIDALAAALRPDRPGLTLRLGTPVTSITGNRANGQAASFTLTLATGERLTAQAVVLATPAFVSAQLLASLDADLASLLARIPYEHGATLTLRYPAADLVGIARGRGVLVPAAAGRLISAVTWVTEKFPDRAPAGEALVRVFLVPSHPAALDAADDVLVSRALDELAALTGLRTRPTDALLLRQPNALPIFRVGHRQLVAALAARCAAWPGLALAGAAYQGVGLPDCITSGSVAAATVLEALAQPTAAAGSSADAPASG